MNLKHRSRLRFLLLITACICLPELSARILVGQTHFFEFSSGDRPSRPPILKINVERAIAIAKEPVEDNGSSDHSWAKYQIEKRLGRFDPGSTAWLNNSGLHEFVYSFSGDDAEKWHKLLLDEQADNYARICASIMVYKDSMDARSFLSEMLEKKEIPLRMNAALALVDAAKKHGGESAEYANRELTEFMNETFVDSETKDWDSIEDIGVGTYREMYRFLRIVAGHLVSAQEERLFPVLWEIAERDQRFEGMILFLRAYKSDSAYQMMVEAIESGQFDSAELASTLGERHYVKAVPVIAGLLGTDLKASSTSRNQNDTAGSEQASILRALLELNDPRCIPDIRRFIESNQFPDEVPQAKRVLIHLTSDNPVTELLELVDSADRGVDTPMTISELQRYADPAILEKLELCARTSSNFWTRLWAIRSIHSVPGVESSLILARLFEMTVPDDLAVPGEPEKEREPGSMKSILFSHLTRCLEERTEQNFYSDGKRWLEWLEANAK